MKAVFVIDVDKDELGEAVATITTKENGITFFAKGFIRLLPEKNTWDVTENGYVTEFAVGWNACIDEILGETE